MSVIVLTRPENAKSALKLGYPCVHSVGDVPAGSHVIRWGNGLDPDKRGWAMVLNKYAAMQVSTDKLGALRAMARVVKTPDIYEAGDSLPVGHRYIERPASHAEGSDFVITDLRTATRGQRVGEDHATRYIEADNEYRVWFVRDKYLVARRIPLTAQGQTEEDTCRSKWGYEFVGKCFPKLAEEVAKARSAIPLDFGAIDCLWKDGEGWYFLEFNSAPSLDTPKVLKHFQTHLQEILATVPTPEVAQVPPPRENAYNRHLERPSVSAVSPSKSEAYAEVFRKKLLLEKQALEERIYKEIYGG